MGNIARQACNQAQTRRDGVTGHPTTSHTASSRHDCGTQTASESDTPAPEGIIATTATRPRLLIIGRTASGKDTLADALRHAYGMTFVKSCTTRPRRTPDEDTHVFLTEQQAEPLVRDAVAYTRIGDYIYFRWSSADPSVNVSHVGIVRSVEETTLTTFEGNVGKKVVSRDFKLDDSRIVGYGHPDYPLAA